MIDPEQDYQAALDYLYSFVDYSLTRNLRYAEGQFDLSRMYQLMERLGNPEKNYPIIHIAGTKGKGSTAAIIASVLQSAGYRTGFYSSPHMEEFNERIRVDDVFIPKDELVKIVSELKPHVEVIERLTTFELTTAAAFLYFARQNVQVAVIEVGLGGRLDATNIVNPILSVITSLSLDHTKVLGDTLAKIAAEKGGIIKQGKPVVLAPQRDEARLVIERIARDRSAPLLQVGRDFFFTGHQHSFEGQSLYVWRPEEQPLMDRFIEGNGAENWKPVELFIPLLGYHQVENAATAYASLLIISESGFSITNAALQDGFRNVKWPGRFEVVRQHPLVVIDSAHNRDSAAKLRRTVDDYLPGKPVILLFGASEDKDVFGMFTELLPRVQQVIATESIHPRALKAEQLVEMAHHFGVSAHAILPFERALNGALDIAGDESVLLITGSLFIAAAARAVLKPSSA